MENEQDINTAGDSVIKKPNLAIRILHVIWATLLAILLAAGIIMQAPWKVIVLIAIFLAAATILPRRRRKWFWAGVGVVVLAVIVWILLPSNNDGWRPYTFDKELSQLQARYAVPDADNAAIIYNQILATCKQKEANEPNLPDRWFDLVRSGPWSSKDQPEIAAWLEYHEDTIDKILLATRLEKCSFPIVADTFNLGIDMNRGSAMRHWAYTLIAAANNALAEGGTNEAVEKFLAVLKIGKHVCQQPTTLDVLVGRACEAIALGYINGVVVNNDAIEPYLNNIEKAVTDIRHDWATDLPGIIDSEKLMLKNMWGGLFYEVNSEGKVRLSRDPWAMIREQVKKTFAGSTEDDPEVKAAKEKWACQGYWWKRFARVQAILQWFFAPASPEELGRIIDESYEKYYAMTRPDADWSKQPQNMPVEALFQLRPNFRQVAKVMARSDETIYFALHDSYLRALMEQRTTRLIIALRRYKNTNGHWPENLDALKGIAPAEIFVDPINGDSFVYRVTDEDFTLYSKGKNNIDEGGEHKSNWPKEDSPDDQLIWPRPAKLKAVQDKNG